GTVKFEGRIKELVENLPDLAILVEPLLIVRRALREQLVILHRRLPAIVRDDAKFHTSEPNEANSKPRISLNF
ncbi:MAG: hypothetical protein WBX95_10155, partial [Xanthobacteraceae bacterium]